MDRVAYKPVDQRIHLRPRLSNPTSMPATIAISAATMGWCSIVVSYHFTARESGGTLFKAQ